jgi:hypothetical protein
MDVVSQREGFSISPKIMLSTSLSVMLVSSGIPLAKY